mmetsp:Transcript_11542/g.29106  ORF Transcript_11542/g.29106 Transcript_11542/m.29106 type:complete len:262 (+) Transcript_11542:162-947(+)
MTNSLPSVSPQSKLMSSTTFSTMVCRRLAPMFSTVKLTSLAIAAMRLRAASVNSSETFSTCISSTCCCSKLNSGSVRMRCRSASDSGFSSTRTGSRPCSSAIKSDGLHSWNAPLQMNKILEVSTDPCLVLTMVPSMRGSRSRCTPSSLASVLVNTPECLHTLSISSMKTMPSSCAFSSAVFTSDALSPSLSWYIFTSVCIAVFTGIFCAFWPRCVISLRFDNSWLITSPGFGGAASVLKVKLGGTSRVISTSSNLPSRSMV